jgi:DNA end-binding protein Ku
VHAIAQVVLSGREQLVLLEPLDRIVAMRILHHESQVKLPAELHDELVEQQVSEVELQLTKTLVEASRIASFDYASYEDSYVTRLTRLIEAKVEGQELVQVADPQEPKILNLMDALKQSVARAKLG